MMREWDKDPDLRVCNAPNCQQHGKSPCEGVGCDGRTDDERSGRTRPTEHLCAWRIRAERAEAEAESLTGDIAEWGDEYARITAEMGTFKSATVGTVLIKGTDEWHELNLKQLLDQEYTRGYRQANADA